MKSLLEMETERADAAERKVQTLIEENRQREMREVWKKGVNLYETQFVENPDDPRNEKKVQRLLQELRNIADATMGKWDMDRTDEFLLEFHAWAQSRANHAITKEGEV